MPEAVNTDGLRSYRAAMIQLGNAPSRRSAATQQPGEEQPSAIPTTRAGDAPVQADEITSEVCVLNRNHFAQERHLVERKIYKERRSAALAEWQSLANCASTPKVRCAWRISVRNRLTPPLAGLVGDLAEYGAKPTLEPRLGLAVERSAAQEHVGTNSKDWLHRFCAFPLSAR